MVYLQSRRGAESCLDSCAVLSPVSTRECCLLSTYSHIACHGWAPLVSIQGPVCSLSTGSVLNSCIGITLTYTLCTCVYTHMRQSHHYHPFFNSGVTKLLQIATEVETSKSLSLRFSQVLWPFIFLSAEIVRSSCFSRLSGVRASSLKNIRNVTRILSAENLCFTLISIVLFQSPNNSRQYPSCFSSYLMRFLAPQKIETIVHFRFGESGHVNGSILQTESGKFHIYAIHVWSNDF